MSRTKPEPNRAADPDTRPLPPAHDDGRPLARRHRFVGFLVLLVALATGAALEALLGVKATAYLLDPLRRELWTLAHLHAGGLALVNLAYAHWADAAELSTRARLRASSALVVGTALLPLGFFFGGIAHPEGDPSIAVALVPLGALLVIGAIAAQTVAAGRAR